MSGESESTRVYSKLTEITGALEGITATLTHIDRRVTALETDNHETQGLNVSVTNFERRVADIETGQDGLWKKLNESTQTDWKLLLGVLLAMTTGIGWVFNTVSGDRESKLEPIESRLSHVEAEYTYLREKYMEVVRMDERQKMVLGMLPERRLAYRMNSNE